MERSALYSSKPVEDTVPKVDNELAVGDDIEFQRKWWRFENFIWIVFGLIVIADLLGCFGRGPLAKAQARSTDGTMDVRYERIARYGTASVIAIQFGPGAIQDGKLKFWVSDSLVKPLGNQRVVPQPETSTVGDNGIYYTFLATALPASVQFSLEPSSAGLDHLTFRSPNGQSLTLPIFVMP